MLEILVCEDKEKTKDLYTSLDIEYKEEYLSICAMAGDECLGFALFEISGGAETVFAVEPKNDPLLADGLLRSALHVGTERGITKAFFCGDDYVELYKKINFIEDLETKELKLQNLYSDCCACKKE
ncbi:MAG: hypothetical protein IJD71_06065 [Clostridia bacterium]|nr:hypothetical protein [Clostridia bacterium]MBQ9919944.1 hypothetical protein [Clostridia bacterium]